MAAVTFGPHRGADWLARVASDLDASAPSKERFVLRLRDPKHPRSLWLSWTLVRSPATCQVHVNAILFDGLGQSIHQAQETWPVARLQVDPVRCGLGVGESHLAHDGSGGLVKGDSFALSWDASWSSPHPDRLLAPGPSWATGRWLSHKIAVLHPGAYVTSGFIELWQTLGRAANKQRLDISGWQAVGTHLWLAPKWAPYAAVHAHNLGGAGSGQDIDIVSCPQVIAGLWHSQAALGWATTGDKTLSLRGRRQLHGAAIPRLSNNTWAFRVEGHDGTLAGEVEADPAACAYVPTDDEVTLLVCERAILRATMQPVGQPPQPVTARGVSFEALLPL